METLSALLAAIPQPDVAVMARAQQHIDGLLKPPGSLGRLETLAVQLAGLPGLQGQLALAMHLLDAASVMYNQMGTLAQSNIVLPDSAPSS